MDLEDNILFITGRLAENNLKKVIELIENKNFKYEVRNLGINVAALMTIDIIEKNIGDVEKFNKIIIPGKARGDIKKLSKKLKTLIIRGPDELKDLPVLFGAKPLKYDLSKYEAHIFAEITDAALLSIDNTIKIANDFRNRGADIIDIGCLPNEPFPHLEELIQELKRREFYVSVDSHNENELITGSKAGADYILSLKSTNIHLLDEIDSIPILIPDKPDDMNSLFKIIDTCIDKKRTFVADPILEPIHHGFTESIVRYYMLREKYPEIHIMMGTGNITELTHADTTGITMTLMGIISELQINHILTTEVSNHCATVINETDIARRIALSSKIENVTPKHIHNGLLTTHSDKSFSYSLDEIKKIAKDVKDSNYRIMLSDKGVSLFNKNKFLTEIDPYDFFNEIEVDGDIGHAFYLGVELARAQIAFQLKKEYEQDEELNWGCIVKRDEEDKLTFKEAGPTYKKKNDS